MGSLIPASQKCVALGKPMQGKRQEGVGWKRHPRHQGSGTGERYRSYIWLGLPDDSEVRHPADLRIAHFHKSLEIESANTHWPNAATIDELVGDIRVEPVRR